MLLCISLWEVEFAQLPLERHEQVGGGPVPWHHVARHCQVASAVASRGGTRGFL